MKIYGTGSYKNGNKHNGETTEELPVLILEAFSLSCNHIGRTMPKNSEKPKMQIFLDEFMSTSCRLDTPTPAIIPGAVSNTELTVT